MGDKSRDTDGTGVCAMSGAECIVHIKIRKLSQSFGEARIVCFLFRLKPEIFEQSDIAIAHMSNNLFWNLADGIVTENHRLINQVV